MRPKISDINILPRFLLTVHNAYFQDSDFSQFTGIIPREGELHRSLVIHKGEYAYLPLTAMLTLIETLGSLLTDKSGIKNNLETFIAEFMSQYSPHTEILYLLRNTMVHEWEGGMVVNLDLSDPATRHMQWEDDAFAINLVTLYKDLKAALQALTEKSESDPAFFSAATSRLKRKTSVAELKADKATQ